VESSKKQAELDKKAMEELLRERDILNKVSSSQQHWYTTPSSHPVVSTQNRASCLERNVWGEQNSKGLE
jgi:hypothetical protein